MTSRETNPLGFAILLIDKPAGPTSHELVGWVRWSLGTRAVGHCGTLDPSATGLLVICVGAATRLAADLTALDKTYRATFRFGTATDTGDADGRVVATAPLPDAFQQCAAASVQSLAGELRLPPPAYSAVRVDGVRAHELARSGAPCELEPRVMTVRALGESTFQWGDGHLDVSVEVSVSKGTYVRSLAEELGRRTGVPCHLAALERVRCGALALDNPAVLRGLTTTELPPRANGAPVWRVRRDDALDRAGCRALICRHLREPGPHLPYPVLAPISPADEHGLRLLAHGQRISAGSELARAWQERAGKSCARFALDGTLGGERVFALVAGVEGSEPLLAPIRVIRPALLA